MTACSLTVGSTSGQLGQSLAGLVGRGGCWLWGVWVLLIDSGVSEKEGVEGIDGVLHSGTDVVPGFEVVEDDRRLRDRPENYMEFIDYRVEKLHC
jgi:hypothetical protein